MTVAALPAVAEYLEDGVTTSFPVPYRFKAPTDLVVERITAGDVATLTLNIDYTVSGGLTDAGGAVVRSVATSGATLRIRRQTARAQPMVYTTGDRFPAVSHEEALDRQMLIAQEQAADHADLDSRALTVPAGEIAPPLAPLASRIGGGKKVLAIDQESGAFVVEPIGETFQGNTGPANSTYDTIAKIAASDITNGSAILAPSEGSGLTGATYTWKAGDYTGRNDVIASTSVPISEGAWVLPDARSLVAQLNAPGSAILAQDDLNAERISILRFAGVDFTGVTESTDGIQNAANWLSSVGGGVLEITRGNYKTTRPIDVPSNVSLVGQGPCSFLRPQSCNGLNILKSDGIGPRQISDFWIYGNGGDNFSAIVADIAFPDRVTGLTISRMYVSFFGTAVKGRGFWHTSFDKFTINQVHNGILLYDRNVHVTVDTTRITRGGLVTGAGPSVGVQIGDSVSALRPEDIHINKTITVGFDDGLYWRNCLAGTVIACTFDFCKRNGIHVVTADGNTAFRDIYIQIDAEDGTLRGVYAEALGSLPGVGTVVFDTVSIRANTVPSVPGQLLSFGFDVANNQANIKIDDCSSEGVQVDVRADGAQRCKITRYNGSAQALLFALRECSIADNRWPGGIQLSGNAAMNYGKNFGAHTTEIIASIDIPANATTATVTYLSLNMPDLPLGGYSISAVPGDYGTLPHTGVALAPSRTAITVNTANALPVLSTVTFHLKVY